MHRDQAQNRALQCLCHIGHGVSPEDLQAIHRRLLPGLELSTVEQQGRFRTPQQFSLPQNLPAPWACKLHLLPSPWLRQHIEFVAVVAFVFPCGNIHDLFKFKQMAATHSIQPFAISQQFFSIRVDNLICTCLARQSVFLAPKRPFDHMRHAHIKLYDTRKPRFWRQKRRLRR